MGLFRVQAWPGWPVSIKDAEVALQQGSELWSPRGCAAAMQDVYDTHQHLQGQRHQAGVLGWPVAPAPHHTQQALHRAGTHSLLPVLLQVWAEMGSGFTQQRDPETATPWPTGSSQPTFPPARTAPKRCMRRSRSTEGKRSASCRLSGKTRSASLQGYGSRGHTRGGCPGMGGGGWATEQRLGDDISERGLVLRWESLKCHDSVPGILRRTQPFFGELVRGMALP